MDGGDRAIIVMRRAVVADRKRIFEWRNSESTRRYFFDPSPIPWQTHVAWFERALAAEHVHLLIGEVGGEPVGVLRYDVDGRFAEVSVYLVPGMVGLGLGTKLLAEGTDWVRRNLAGVERLRARVVGGNKASLRAFEKAGYRCSVCDFECEV